MMGVIFEAARRAIIAQHDEDTWDQLLEDAGLVGAYTSLGMYPHSDLQAVVAAAAKRLDSAEPEIWRSVGRSAFGHLHDHMPERVNKYASSRELFGALDKTIHAHVSTIYPDASPPRFEVVSDSDGLTLIYHSRRQLCHLAEGLAAGVLDHYDEEGAVEQVACGINTGEPCQINVQYHAKS